MQVLRILSTAALALSVVSASSYNFNQNDYGDYGDNTPAATPAPSNPATPGSPATPSTPGAPGTGSGVPGTTATPGTPGAPGSGSGVPGTPATPGTPGAPGTPATPGSGSGVPGTPATPGTPGAPGKPTTPGAPGSGSGVPGTPGAPGSGSGVPASPAPSSPGKPGSGSGNSDSPLAGGNAKCGSARVRKPWESLSAQEQSLYIEAVGLVIKSGVAKDFAAMHLETMGETQAHHSCGFFAWHRRMLLAFESYLRDLDPKFKCLTIPFYDVHTAYVNAANKKCKNMYECSPIFAALGGAVTSDQDKLLFNGQQTSGFQVKGAPFTAECDDNKEQCGCMLRNDLVKRAVPSGAGFGTFLDIVTRSKDYATFLENIQFGIHNEVHNAVGGVMSTFASPRDVFFYSWHSAIDMYLTVYHQCQLGTALTEEQLKTSLEAFTQATQTCGGVSGVGPDSNIVMNIKVDGKLVEASQHPTLGKYFNDVGDEMWNYGETTRLGDYSYSYEMPSIIKTQILSNQDICKGLKNSSPTPAPSQAPATGANATTPVPAGSVAPHSGIIVVNEKDSTATTSSPSYGSGDDSDDSGSADAGKALGKLTPTAATTGDYWKWIQTTYDGLVKRFNGDMTIVTEQMRVIECLAFDNVFGVVEFSDDFVANFHLASSKPVCGKKIDAVTSGNVTIAVEVPATDFKPEQVKFAAVEVIETVKKQAVEAAKSPEVEAPQIAPAFVKTAEKVLQEAKTGMVTTAYADAPKTGDAAPKSGETRSANDSPAVAVKAGSDGKGDKKKKHNLCH